nr:hypothetical protein [Ceratobasidium bipartite virus 1]
MAGNDDFDAILSGLMGRVGNVTSAPTRAETIEQAAAQPQAIATRSVGLVTNEGQLPLVTEDMTLKELREVMEKYGKVVERGAYLYEWTGGKAAKLGTLDPKELGRERMTAIERRALDWWEENGDKGEFDWSKCTEEGKVPEGKVGKYNDELRALRWMYGKKDLVLQNWFWVRKNSEARAHVVWALVKIVKASQDITNGLDTSDALGVAEYQTANKIISVASTNVRTFMEGIHKLLRPIDDGLNLVIARKISMGARLGIKQKKVGTANRQAELFGQGKVGKVTKPDDVPTGQKRVREETTTIEALRKLKVSRRGLNEEPTRDELPPLGRQGPPHITGAASPQYRPSSPALQPTGPTTQDLTGAQRKRIVDAMRLNDPDSSVWDEISGWDKPTIRTHVTARAQFTRDSKGKVSVDVPREATRAESTVMTLVAHLLEGKKLTTEQAAHALGRPDLWSQLCAVKFGADDLEMAGWRLAMDARMGDAEMST